MTTGLDLIHLLQNVVFRKEEGESELPQSWSNHSRKERVGAQSDEVDKPVNYWQKSNLKKWNMIQPGPPIGSCALCSARNLCKWGGKFPVRDFFYLKKPEAFWTYKEQTNASKYRPQFINLETTFQ